MYLASLLGVKHIDEVQVKVSLEPQYIILTAMHNLPPQKSDKMHH